MIFKQFGILVGLVLSALLFNLNLRGHLQLYPDRRTLLTWSILLAEIIKTVGGTLLSLIWMASSLLLMDAASGFLGSKGNYVAIIMLFPVAVIFYFIMAGFIRLIDSFPELIHDHDQHDHFD